MVLAGVHARISDKRYDVAVAVVDESAVLEYMHVAAAAGEAESGQLSVLHARAHEVLRPHAVELVVLWPPDPSPGGKVKLLYALATGRAEGAVLSAAGQLGLPSERISGAGVRAAAGGCGTDQAIDDLCSALTDVPADQPVRRAAAAALAWQIRASKA